MPSPSPLLLSHTARFFLLPFFLLHSPSSSASIFGLSSSCRTRCFSARQRTARQRRRRSRTRWRRDLRLLGIAIPGERVPRRRRRNLSMPATRRESGWKRISLASSSPSARSPRAPASSAAFASGLSLSLSLCFFHFHPSSVVFSPFFHSLHLCNLHAAGRDFLRCTPATGGRKTGQEFINSTSNSLSSGVRTIYRLSRERESSCSPVMNNVGRCIKQTRPGLRDHDRVADLIVARRSIDRSAIGENLIF